MEAVAHRRHVERSDVRRDRAVKSPPRLQVSESGAHAAPHFGVPPLEVIVGGVARCNRFGTEHGEECDVGGLESVALCQIYQRTDEGGTVG